MKLTYLLIGMAFIGLQASKAETIDVKLPCKETKVIAETLKEFEETPFIYGITSDAGKSIMTLWINPSLGTWTILATIKDMTCVIGYGTDLKLVPQGPRT